MLITYFRRLHHANSPIGIILDSRINKRILPQVDRGAGQLVAIGINHDAGSQIARPFAKGVVKDFDARAIALRIIDFAKGHVRREIEFDAIGPASATDQNFK